MDIIGLKVTNRLVPIYRVQGGEIFGHRYWDYTVGARALPRLTILGDLTFNRDYTAVSGQTQCFTFDLFELLFCIEEPD